MKAEIKRGFLICGNKCACLSCLESVSKVKDKIVLYYWFQPVNEEKHHEDLVFDYEEKLYNDLESLVDICNRRYK